MYSFCPLIDTTIGHFMCRTAKFSPAILLQSVYDSICCRHHIMLGYFSLLHIISQFLARILWTKCWGVWSSLNSLTFYKNYTNFLYEETIMFLLGLGCWNWASSVKKYLDWWSDLVPYKSLVFPFLVHTLTILPSNEASTSIVRGETKELYVTESRHLSG